MTSGPTGMEAAASFYLNKNITAWRHYAMKALGIAIPLFLISTGFLLFVMFDQGGKKKVKLKEKHLSKAVHSALGLVVCYIRAVHLKVFREHYDHGRVEPLLRNN